MQVEFEVRLLPGSRVEGLTNIPILFHRPADSHSSTMNLAHSVLDDCTAIIQFNEYCVHDVRL